MSGTAQRSGNGFRCHRFGDPRRPALLLLHGFLGCGQDFEALATMLEDRVHGLALDLPGHGQTRLEDDDPAWSVEGCASAILRWLDSERIASPHLLGYSMGGRIALRLAVIARPRFREIVIESASPGLESPDERAQRQLDDARLAAKLRTEPLERFVDDWYAQPMFARLALQPTFADLRRRRLRQHPGQLALSLERMGLGSQQSLWRDLPVLSGRVHFAVGAEDGKYRRLAARAAQLSPRIEVRVFEGAGHNVHFEQPRCFADYIGEIVTAGDRRET